MKHEMYDAMFEIENRHWWFKAKKNIILKIIKKIQSDNKPKILDIGCGCGLMLDELQELGDVEGLDFSEEAIEYCAQSFDGKLIQWDLNKSIIFDDKYNIVIALDVLEHIENDVIAIKSIANALSSNGVAIITVPANPWMWSKHDENCMHKRRYTKKNLTELAIASGLYTEYISYYDFWLFPPVALVRSIEKLFNKNESDGKESIENKVPNKIINGILYKIFSSEAEHICKGKTFPFGVSLICVLRKK